MGQILHGCAKTTATVRRAIQNSKESLNVLSERYAINPKTVSKWRKRNYVTEMLLWVQRLGAQQYSRWKKKLLSFHSGNIHYCL